MDSRTKKAIELLHDSKNTRNVPKIDNIVIKVVTSPANLGFENMVLRAKEKFKVAAEYMK